MPPADRPPRGSLSRQAVVDAALALADAEGLAAVTIRAVAARLGSKPMSLYRHVPGGKDELLDALVERLYAEFDAPEPTAADWRAELAARSESVRAVLVRHPWSLGLIETRSGADRPVALAHAEAVLATLVAAGFSPTLAARAFVVLDSFVYGFALQSVTMPSTDPAETVTEDLLAGLAAYPTTLAVAEAVAGDPAYRFEDDFDRGLALVLDGLEAWRRPRRDMT
jgi:AcrR family transcriptional regulator